VTVSRKVTLNSDSGEVKTFGVTVTSQNSLHEEIKLVLLSFCGPQFEKLSLINKYTFIPERGHYFKLFLTGIWASVHMFYIKIYDNKNVCAAPF
jgi:hypothetical protein